MTQTAVGASTIDIDDDFDIQASTVQEVPALENIDVVEGLKTC